LREVLFVQSGKDAVTWNWRVKEIPVDDLRQSVLKDQSKILVILKLIIPLLKGGL
jgi:hypothetical protein